MFPVCEQVARNYKKLRKRGQTTLAHNDYLKSGTINIKGIVRQTRSKVNKQTDGESPPPSFFC